MLPTHCADASFRPGSGGIHVPAEPVPHRDEEYDPAGFDTLREMQDRHFWYRGRHRFLLYALMRELRSRPDRGRGLSAIDLGGGCGGWVRYLNRRASGLFGELALGDSSLRALGLSGPVVGPSVKRFQIDLLRLPWRGRWDVAFLLDVLEHIPDDAGALRQAAEALRPGGLLFVTTPALRAFWSYNDDLAHHVRRYSRNDFRELAARCGLELRRSRYFMFFLSPLLLLSRMRGPDAAELTPAQAREHLARTHRVPAAPVNQLLRGIFSLETPLGSWLPFPWGTSLLGIFRKRG